jgi:hypothetical protein
MTLPLAVKSNYYKGLLILLKRDRCVDPREKEFMIRIGRVLDFDKRFCEAAIDESLVNSCIGRTPILFSDEDIKDCFFRDALRLAWIDGTLHQMELSWLRRAAIANGRTNGWFDALICEFQKKKDCRDDTAPFEIQKYLASSHPPSNQGS